MQSVSCAGSCARLWDSPQRKVALVGCATLTIVFETLALLSFLGMLHGINTLGASLLAGTGILILPTGILLAALASRRTNLREPQIYIPTGTEDLINKLPPNMLQKIFEYTPQQALKLVCKKWNGVINKVTSLEIACLYNQCISESERLYAESVLPVYRINLNRDGFGLGKHYYGDSCWWADILGLVAVSQAYTSPKAAKETAARMFRPTKWMHAEALCKIAEIDEQDNYKHAIEAVKLMSEEQSENKARFLCRIVRGQVSRGLLVEAKETLLSFQELPQRKTWEMEAKCAIAQYEKDNTVFDELMDRALEQNMGTEKLHFIRKYQATFNIEAAKEKAARLRPIYAAKAFCSIAKQEVRSNKISDARETIRKIATQINDPFVGNISIGGYERAKVLCEIAKIEGDFQEVLNETARLEKGDRQKKMYERIALGQAQSSLNEAKQTALLIEDLSRRTKVLSTLARLEGKGDFKLAIETALTIPEGNMIPYSQAIALSRIAADQACTDPKAARETMKLALAKCRDELVRINALSVFAEGLAQIMLFYKKRKD